MDSKLDSFGSYVEAVRAMPLADQAGSTAEATQEEQGEDAPAKSKKVRGSLSGP